MAGSPVFHSKPAAIQKTRCRRHASCGLSLSDRIDINAAGAARFHGSRGDAGALFSERKGDKSKI
jgi:hypothetical protein